MGKRISTIYEEAFIYYGNFSAHNLLIDPRLPPKEGIMYTPWPSCNDINKFQIVITNALDIYRMAILSISINCFVF